MPFVSRHLGGLLALGVALALAGCFSYGPYRVQAAASLPAVPRPASEAGSGADRFAWEHRMEVAVGGSAAAGCPAGVEAYRLVGGSLSVDPPATWAGLARGPVYIQLSSSSNRVLLSSAPVGPETRGPVVIEPKSLGHLLKVESVRADTEAAPGAQGPPPTVHLSLTIEFTCVPPA